jgi:hypothetical protein
MSYQPDDPRSPRSVAQDDNGIIDTIAKVAVLFACTFIVAFVLYAMNHDDQIAATSNSPAPAVTTGQSQGEQKAAPKSDNTADPNSEPKTK